MILRGYDQTKTTQIRAKYHARFLASAENDKAEHDRIYHAYLAEMTTAKFPLWKRVWVTLRSLFV